MSEKEKQQKCNAIRNNGKPCKQTEIVMDTGKCIYHQGEKFSQPVSEK